MTACEWKADIDFVPHQNTLHFLNGAAVIVEEEDLALYRRAYQSDLLPSSLLNLDRFTSSVRCFELKSPKTFQPSPDDELTVAVVFAFLGKFPALPRGLTWAAVSHQAGGCTCEQHYFILTELDVRPSLYDGLCRIALDRWPGQRSGWKGTHTGTQALQDQPNELAAYKAELAELDLQYSGDWLTESMYPIDATQANLDRLCKSKLNLHELGLDFTKLADIKASILFISPNSD